MSIERIGENISRLRKQKGITQDELAQSVGVSAQAVSKWERGGVPDIELLPTIADYFDISIDALFGRDRSSMHVDEIIAEKIRSTPKEERINALFELCWIAEKALFGETALENGGTAAENRAEADEKYGVHSCYLSDDGFTYMRFGREMPYFFLSPDKYLMREMLEECELCELFETLSHKDIWDAFLLLYTRSNKKMFTEKLLETELNITHERACEIIKILKRYWNIDIRELELDDGILTTYTFTARPHFIAMLMFARECMIVPRNFCYYMGDRGEAYIK